MHAATVELLVQKAHLDPDTALAIATAIDMALQNAQLVTVAVLDARFLAFEARMDGRFAASNAEMKAGFAALNAEMKAGSAALKAEMKAGSAALEAKWSAAHEKTKAEVVRWVFLVLLGNVALSLAANALQNALQHLR